MNRITITAVLLFIFIAACAKDESPVTTTSTLKSVTVYRSGAGMVHNASATLKQGKTG